MNQPDYFDLACDIARSQDQLHREATSIRASLTYADLAATLEEGKDPDATALLNAVLDYDNAEIGRLMSKMVQDYCRGLASKKEPEALEIPRFLRKQAD